MRHRPIQAAPRERVPFTLWGPKRIRHALATATAAAIGLVPAVFVASPAYAAAADGLVIAEAGNYEGGTLTFKFTYTGAQSATFTLSATPQDVSAGNYKGVGGNTAALAASLAANGGASNGQVDYDNTNLTTVTFPASSVSSPSTTTVSFATGNDVDAADETFTLTATNTTLAGAAGDNSTKTAVGTIWAAPSGNSLPTLSLSAPATVQESDASATVVASLSRALDHDVTIGVSAGAPGGTYAAGTTAVSTGGVNRDFTAPAADASITILAGRITGSLNVAINDDNVDEADTQYFGVRPQSPLPGGMTAINSYVDVGIADNDATPTVSIADAPAVNENTAASFPIKLSGLSEKTLKVDFATSAASDTATSRAATSGTDFTATTATVTFDPLQQTAYQTVTTASDLAVEGTETFTATLSKTAAPGASAEAAALGTPTSATGTIKDVATLPDLDVTDMDLLNDLDAGDNSGYDSDVFYDEGSSGTVAKEIEVKIDLNGNSRETPVKLDYSFTDGTATNGVDYKGTAGTITIPTTETGVGNSPNNIYTAKIPVTIVGDTTYEGAAYGSGRAEDFSVTFKSSNGTISTATLGSQTVYIVEGADDTKPTWTTSDVSVVEGNEGATMAKVPITLSSPIGTDVTFTADFTTPGSATETGVNTGATAGDNDYDIPSNKTVTIKAGQTTGFLEVPINGDAVYERDEALVVAFDPPSSNAVKDDDTADVQHTSRISITNDDAKPTVKFNEVSGSEGTTARISATLVGVSQYAYTLGVAVAGTGDNPATPGTDFEVPANLATTKWEIARGQTAFADSKLAEFYLLPDDVDEPTEAYGVTLSEITAAPQGFTPVTGTYRITDDPADLPPAASIRDESIGEWEQSVDVHVDFAFDENTKSTTQTVNIPWWTVDGSAKAGEDYKANKGVITLKPGDLSATVNVEVINDKLKEDEENFWVKLGTATPTGAAVARATGEVTIKSEDKADPVTPTLSATGPSKGVGLAKFMGTAAPNTTVELWGAPLPEMDPKAFKYISETHADDDGYFELTPKSLASGWAFVVRSQEINSAVKTVKVTQLPSFSASSSKKGKLSVSVAGNPRAAGQAVSVQRYTGGKWVTIGKGTTTDSGWKGTISIKSKSKVTLRAWVAGDSSMGINGGYSAQKKVTIK